MNLSCNNCRTRHYKCDGKVPQCGRCERTGRPCVRETRWKFKHRQFPARDQQRQKWLPVPPKVDFVAENGLDGDDSDEGDDVQQSPIHAGVVPAADLSLDADIILDPALTHQPSAIPLTSHEDPASLSPFTSLTTSALWIADVERLHSTAVGTPQSIGTPGQAVPPNQWPLRVEEEAMLLRFFVEKVSSFFDVSEPIQYFRVDIPQRARTNDTLANAILALSSRILQWKNGYSPHIADRYYQRCLEALIPALNDETLVMDETLLAATIFLRMLEEMDSHISGFDDGGHLSGTQAIISVATNTYGHIVPTGFRLAAYWTAFRQELWLALHKQQPVTMSVRRVCGFDDAHGFGPAPDWVWCQRAVAHCADVLDCIFGNDEAGREEAAKRWKWLLEDNARWWSSLPKSFEPFFGRWDDADEDRFPDVRLHLEFHVMGYAYIVLARLLLIVHDPTIPTLGPQRRQAIAEIDEKARRDVRILCGIGLSNDAVPPAILISCMAATLFGDRFTNHMEQERLYMVLLETERRHGWPTAKARTQLKELWGC